MTRRDFLAALVSAPIASKGVTPSTTGHVLTSGVLSANDHEDMLGYASVGSAKALTIMAVPGSVPHQTLRGYLNEDVEVLLRLYQRNRP